MAEPRLLQGLKRLCDSRPKVNIGSKGSVLAGGQIGGCSGRLCNSPKYYYRVARDIHRSS